MIAHCPNCGIAYETTEEIANEPSWCNRRARWCPKCLGVTPQPVRLTAHELRLRRYQEEMDRRYPDPFGGFRPRTVHLPTDERKKR